MSCLDEGKEAFQDMMSAVNNADERVNGISGDIEKTLSKAVSFNTLINQLVASSSRTLFQESAPVKY